MAEANAARVNANKRVCATLIDLFIIDVMNVFCLGFLRLPMVGYNSISQILFFLMLVFRDGYQGRSPGKMFVGLRVVDVNDKPASFFASFKRNIVLFWVNLFSAFIPASSAPLGQLNWTPEMIAAFALIFISFTIYLIEYFLCAYGKDGRRMGDRIAGTRVVDLRPDTPGWIFALLSMVILLVMVFANVLFARRMM
jgi:uncharacterized RDD family membrane protein YckC